MLKVREKGISLVLNNNNLEFVKEMYIDKKFDVNFIYASRSVNSNPLQKGNFFELLIAN